jgi:rhodanese-related sulfurtransferase
MRLITRDELRAKLQRGDEFKLVMTLPPHAYRAKRIPTSLHFDSTEQAAAELDRGDEIVVYCADVYCAASIVAYRDFERRGYTRLRRYAGGIADWEGAGYPLVHDSLEPRARRPDEGRRGTPPARLPWAICA